MWQIGFRFSLTSAAGDGPTPSHAAVRTVLNFCDAFWYIAGCAVTKAVKIFNQNISRRIYIRLLHIILFTPTGMRDAHQAMRDTDSR